jgi:hypothetical protein
MQWIGTAALTVATALFMVACSATPAIGTPNTTPPVTCSSISGNVNTGAHLKLGGCTGKTGGSGTAVSTFTPMTIHWAAGGKTTVTFNPLVQQVGACPGGTTGFKLHDGKVKSSTVAGIFGAFHAWYCIDSAGIISLFPGTVMSF